MAAAIKNVTTVTTVGILFDESIYFFHLHDHLK